jgi:hypothetical protein
MAWSNVRCDRIGHWSNFSGLERILIARTIPFERKAGRSGEGENP